MTTTIKTAISIQKSLFDQAEALAQQLKVSRSYLFCVAMEDFLQNHKSQALLDEINRANDDQPDDKDRFRMSQMRRNQRKLLEGEW